MNILESLITEALSEKSFETTEELVKSIRSILRKSSMSSYKEKKSANGFTEPTRHGYKMTNLNGNITLGFMGVSNAEINELANAFADAKINYKYNQHNQIFFIESKNNVNPNSLMSKSAIAEFDHGIYDVIGAEAEAKTDIKKVIGEFNSTQRKIYDELLDYGKVYWNLLRSKKGNNEKFKYILSKMEK